MCYKLSTMLSTLILNNFKCFGNQVIPFRAPTIIVGRNNAGKSTIVEALRLLSLVVNHVENLPLRGVPSWLDIPIVNGGFAPSLENYDFNFSSVFHRYNPPPARILAKFDTGVSVEIYIGGKDMLHAVIKDRSRDVVTSGRRARTLGLHRVGILPQISPLSEDEIILVPRYVRQKMSSNLASLHFRNQINLLYEEAFDDFKSISESTWSGLRIMELRGKGGEHGTPLELLVRNDDFVAEIAWMGHGLQMWLQTMWFLARSTGFETVILDEPDVYMHADLQRRLIRFLKERHPQAVVATHSIEIMSEVDPENILVVDRDRRQAQFTMDVPEVQQVVDQIGGIGNLQLARLWNSRRCIFIEGKDLSIMKHWQNRLFPTSKEPIDAVPNVSVGGWGGWNYAIGSAMLLRNAVNQNIAPYCILDSDYHTPGQIEARKKEATEKGLNLHIWERKEVENYLLVPDAIFRTVEAKAKEQRPKLSAKLIGQKLYELAGQRRDEVTDAYAAEFLSENRSAGPTHANRSARALVGPSWDMPWGRFSLVSGKQLLAELSEWLQRNYGVAVSAARIARTMRLHEISEEVLQILTAIENNESL
jgi:hypothetical protein